MSPESEADPGFAASLRRTRLRVPLRRLKRWGAGTRRKFNSLTNGRLGRLMLGSVLFQHFSCRARNRSTWHGLLSAMTTRLERRRNSARFRARGLSRVSSNGATSKSGREGRLGRRLPDRPDPSAQSGRPSWRRESAHGVPRKCAMAAVSLAAPGLRLRQAHPSEQVGFGREQRIRRPPSEAASSRSIPALEGCAVLTPTTRLVSKQFRVARQ
jgi:hypothetical protein